MNFHKKSLAAALVEKMTQDANVLSEDKKALISAIYNSGWEPIGGVLALGPEEEVDEGEEDTNIENDPNWDEDKGFINPPFTKSNSKSTDSLTGKKLWLLYVGTDQGNREDCNIFYADPECYEHRHDALARQKQLKTANQNTYNFYTHLSFIVVS